MPSSPLQAISVETIQVIIPALNEEASIAGVVGNLRNLGLYHIRVVDNGSTDNTTLTAQTAGAEVVTEMRPGYGSACWAGLQNLPPGIEWVLFCDADGSDVLEELPRFLQSALDADFVLGNRRASPEGRNAMTPAQNFGNWLSTTLIHLGWGGKFADLGPLRLIRRESLARLQMRDRGFGWTVEMQARAVEERLTICELPVRYRNRQGGKSKISGTVRGSINAGIVILGTLGKLYVGRLLKGLTLPAAQNRLLILSACLLVAGAAVMEPFGNFQVVGMVPLFLVGAALMSTGFLAALALKNVPWVAFWGVAIVTRLILLPMVPGDDIWRYLWEGWIQNHGVNPYGMAPLAQALEPLRTSWWPLINNPDIAAIYPPLAQLCFRALAFFTPSVLLFKMGFLAADLGCCFILQRRFGAVATLAYAWNPLIIYCFAGGGHYDAWFLLPLIAGWLLLENTKAKPRSAVVALLLGSSVALKYTSLPVVLFAARNTFRDRGTFKGLIFCLLAILPFAVSLLLIPNVDGTLLPGRFINIARTSEFIPYWVGLVWPASTRINWIFSIPFAVLTAILVVKTSRTAQFCERYFFGLLLFSPIVHAWYFTWLVPFAVRTRNPGTLLVSVSGFVYFWLKHREAISGSWDQSIPEKLLLWFPLILGFFWHLRHESKATQAA